jgi:peptidoglycan hydrolase-like protein with peptidoglycan-binding domain
LFSKKYMINKVLLLILSFSVPGFIFAAAYDDVTLTTSASIVAGGKTYNIYTVNTVLESLTVNPSNFSFVLDSGSSIRIKSADGTQMTFADSSTVNTVENTCNSTGSILELTGKPASATITVTPTTTACSGSSSSSSSAPAGAVAVSALSSGGGSPAPVVATTTNVPVTPSTVVVGNSGTFAGVTFTKRLTKGSKGKDIENLQKFLATDQDIYPGGQVTGYYGVLTQKAVQKFQEKYSIAKKGSVGYGEVGPATRAKLNLLLKGTAANVTSGTQASLETQIAALLKMAADLTAQVKSQGY